MIPVSLFIIGHRGEETERRDRKERRRGTDRGVIQKEDTKGKRQGNETEGKTHRGRDRGVETEERRNRKERKGQERDRGEQTKGNS